MQAARDRQKSYADKKRKPMDFQVGDKVMLKVADRVLHCLGVHHLPCSLHIRCHLIKEVDPEEEESDDNAASEKEPSEGSDDTEPFEEDETAVTPPPSRLHEARISIRPQTPMPPLSEARVAELLAMLTPPPSPLTPMSEVPEADMPPRKRLCFATPTTGFEAEANITHRHARTLHDTERMMMTAVELVNLRVSYEAQTSQRDGEEFHSQLRDAQRDCAGIRVEIVALRDRVARIETIETRMTEMEDQFQDTRDRAVSHVMHTQVLEARAQTDTMEDAGVVDLSRWFEKMELVFHISSYAIENQVKFVTCTMLDAALTWWNGHVRTLGHDAAYVMTWGTLKKKLTEKYCPKGEIKKLKIKLWNLKFLADETEKVDKYISGLPDNIHGNVMSQNVARAYTAGPGEKKAYTGNLPLCTKCNYHHTGQCAPKCNNYKKYGHATHDFQVNVNNNRVQNMGTCFECGEPWHLKKNCLKFKNNGNANGNSGAQGKAYVLGGGDSNSESNTVTGVNTIMRGCTLDFLNHPFNIDLMSVPLGSFDVIIGMDWLREYNAVIICDKKIVRVPFENETLIFQGKRNDQVHESRLNIILFIKAQKYFSKGCDVFLAHVTTKEAEDKLEGKRLEDVPIVKDFPEDLSGIPPARQVEFQIDLVPGATPVARAPYRLAPSEMKELVDQLQELSDKGFIRPISSP
nr:hypothetical protein [Tanacetum cinerariifolium]